MAEKILYYLGAGASANALPISKSIFGKSGSHQIEGLSYALQQIEINGLFESIKSPVLLNYKEDLKARFKNLSKSAEKFGDVDTYAKFLFLQSDRIEFSKLKKTLGEFFFFKQYFFKSRDSRYLSWLIGIMDQKKFPENIKILSWNYDFQVELASTEFGELESHEKTMSGDAYSFPFISHFPNLDKAFNDFASLSLWHLNGIAGYYRPTENRRELGSLFNQLNTKTPQQMLEHLQTTNFEPLLNFAWEKDYDQSQLFGGIEKMIENTTIMVVIGYSFPYYNREVDKGVFNLLSRIHSFRKIYFQDPFYDGQILKSKFNIKNGVEIIHIPQVENFHIPFEF